MRREKPTHTHTHNWNLWPTWTKHSQNKHGCVCGFYMTAATICLVRFITPVDQITSPLLFALSVWGYLVCTPQVHYSSYRYIMCSTTNFESGLQLRFHLPKHPALGPNSLALCVCKVRIILPKVKSKHSANVSKFHLQLHSLKSVC